MNDTNENRASVDARQSPGFEKSGVDGMYRCERGIVRRMCTTSDAVDDPLLLWIQITERQKKCVLVRRLVGAREEGKPLPPNSIR